MEKFYRHFDSIDSTNRWAKENLSLLPKEALSVIWADEQSGSYGQQKRPWHAPKGEGLWATFCLYDAHPDGFVITRHMSLSILDLLEEQGVEGTLKWPNDILVKEKKMAGILTEIVGQMIVVGVGWNVNMPISTLEKINQPATSLLLEKGEILCMQRLVEALADRFVTRYLDFGMNKTL